MSNSNKSGSNRTNIPEAREAMNRFEYEVANEIGVPLKQGYNGDLTSAQNGYVGGYMVKKMIEAQEKLMADKANGGSGMGTGTGNGLGNGVSTGTNAEIGGKSNS